MTQKQLTALQALLTSRTQIEASEKAGIAPDTMRRYLDDDEFVDAYNTATLQAIENTTNLLRSWTETATQAIIDIIQNEENPASVRLSASKTILDYSIKYTDFRDVAQTSDRNRRIDNILDLGL